MNISSGRPCLSICCKEDTVYPSAARCHWNVSFSSKETIFPKIVDFSRGTKIGPEELILRDQIPCSGNIVCYSDCNSANNISTYSFGNDTTFMNDSINGGLICRLDAKEYCFKSHPTDGTESVISDCETFFDLVTNLKLALGEFSTNLPFFVYPMSISLPFLMVTFVVYTILPELKNLHGLILRTYTSCCFGYFVTMLVIFTNPKISCSPFIMIPMHFATLTTFFWLNVMSFDIWWTFRSMRDCAKQSPRKKYIIYSIYAWGIPTLIIGTGLIIEFVPNVPKGIVKPGLHTGCWLTGQAETAVYLEGPMTLTIACNICFFALAAINITGQKKATAQCLEGSESRRYNDEKSRFYLYLKLFIIMGMTWLSEIQPFVVTLHLPHYVSYILLFPNHVQGLIIFVLFVWSDRTKRLLSKRLGLEDWAAIQWIEHAVTRIRTIAQRVLKYESTGTQQE